MDYTLLVADRSYSSWSLRGWLCFSAFGVPVAVQSTRLYQPGFAEDLKAFAPARTVPALRIADGAVLTDSLAIAEELAQRHPDAGHWPEDPVARGQARSMVAEMHAGFFALREACPMNLRIAYAESSVGDAVRADLARIEELWAQASSGDPWLFGRYTLADAFFAPVAMRIAAYALPVGPSAQAYVAAHLAHPLLRRWRAEGLCDQPQEAYLRPYPEAPWPGPAPLAAEAVDQGPAENAACPYSGKPVTHFLRFQDRVYGFCNARCRDKTVNDPAAFPAFAQLAGIATAPTA